MRPSAVGAAAGRDPRDRRLPSFALRFGRHGSSRRRRRSSPSAAWVEVLEARAMLTGSLQITNTDNQTTAVPGTTVTYTVVVSNTGTTDLSGVLVQDGYPGNNAEQSSSFTVVEAGGASGASDGQGLIGQTLDLPSGSSVTYSVSTGIWEWATGTLAYTVSATDSAEGVSTVSASDTDTLTPQADVSVTMQQKASLNADTYTIVVTNAGPSAAPDVRLIDDFPTYFPVYWYNGNAWTSANLDEMLDLAPGASRTYTVQGHSDNSMAGNFVIPKTTQFAGPPVTPGHAGPRRDRGRIDAASALGA